jgi:hypothetical protein
MNKYINGKIYALVSESAQVVYYGSTIQRLSQRKGEHIRDYKNHLYNDGWKCSSFEVLKHGDAKIILIEEFPCKSRLELEQREGHWQLNNNCTNINRAGRNIKEYRKTPEYREKHKLYMRKYRDKN